MSPIIIWTSTPPPPHPEKRGERGGREVERPPEDPISV